MGKRNHRESINLFLLKMILILASAISSQLMHILVPVPKFPLLSLQICDFQVPLVFSTLSYLHSQLRQLVFTLFPPWGSPPHCILQPHENGLFSIQTWVIQSEDHHGKNIGKAASLWMAEPEGEPRTPAPASATPPLASLPLHFPALNNFSLCIVIF